MPEYIVNLWLDGYDTEEQMEEACGEFIYEQLNFTASSVRVKKSDYASILARHNALVEAVKWMLYIDTPENFEGKSHIEARANVEKLLEEK